VIIELSESASNAMLDVLGGLMDGGRIELLSPASNVLAELQLGNPAAGAAAGGEIELNSISEEDAAMARGLATTARILSVDGGEILRCDIGDENSDAVIRLNSTQIYRNSPVRIVSFKLVMPASET
jgi:hypothetical protein